MRRIATAITVGLLLAVPVAANAASLNQTSDRGALRAYATYLQSLVNGAGKGKHADTAFVASRAKGCTGALAPAINNSSPTKRSRAALREMGEEIGGDIAVSFLREAAVPYRTLARQLDALSWSQAGTKTTVRDFVKALHAVLQVHLSNLCGDAYLLSSKPNAEPAGTKHFLNAYLGDSSKLDQRLSALVEVFERYETKSDSGVVSRIDTLASSFNSISGSDEHASRQALEKALYKS